MFSFGCIGAALGEFPQTKKFWSSRKRRVIPRNCRPIR